MCFAKIVFTSLWLLILLTIFFFFCKVEVLPLNEIQVIEFSLWGIMLLVLYLKKSLPNLDPRFSPMSSRSFIVLYYTFRFMIHLGYFLWWMEGLCIESFSFFLSLSFFLTWFFCFFLSLPPSLPPSLLLSLPFCLSLSAHTLGSLSWHVWEVQLCWSHQSS